MPAPCALIVSEADRIEWFHLQILYGSIGWATGATLGAALAAKEAGRRTILFTGDGSL